MTNFSKTLLKWYDNTPRELPWKNHADAYSVWLSEIIMQQTRVEYGSAYYLKFKQLFPTIFDLANADQSKVLHAWEGLGYYSRARNLHATAQYVANELHGIFPDNYKDIQKLKGVGPYTGAAILSFVHNKAIPAIDGNAYRVLARFFGIKNAIDESKSKKIFFEKGEQLIQQVSHRAGDFNQAIMNFGAMVCKPQNAACQQCPMQASCYAYNNNEVEILPIKKKKTAYKKRYFTFFCMEFENNFLIEERTEKDVWQNLHQFYLIETKKATSWAELIEQSPLRDEPTENYSIIKVIDEKQTLTHQKLNGQIVWVRFNTEPSFYQTHSWASKSEIKEKPFPKMLQNVKKMIILDISS